MIQAIRTILQGHIHLSDAAATHLLGRFRKGPEAAEAPPENALTDRELEVFRLMGSGLSTRDIATRLGLSIKTIGSYRDRIKTKLCVATTADLIRRAVLWMGEIALRKGGPASVGNWPTSGSSPRRDEKPAATDLSASTLNV